ncbi:GntR family transcriptional regulator [Flavobacterium sp. 7A]|uniref:GntR family transcriptional regulator n=1 Tax=Flavobacterium sp. 7A TaxID=2940571 RepID=UPI002226DE94|nr:GntR family transcriptional regulator [Flavobacterium sp. 7A]MCW2120501.1 DNA-binding transcriptional regulator YhcF (GntR family) [Flavobacterium sp. 7A]
MELLFNKIISLKQISTLSKHEQLVQGIIECIENESLVVGDQLPSINQMVENIGFARKTIVKAYEELKDRGLVESKKIKGYFILSNKTDVVLKVALLLYSFHRFQEEFYNSFRKELGERYQIDIYVHHNNLDAFENIISNIHGKYGAYVVAPIENPLVRPLLETIEPSRLLIIDRYLDLGVHYSYIAQEFEHSTHDRLTEILEIVKKYNKIVLYFRNDADYPIGVLKGFERFVAENGLIGEIEKNYRPDSVQAGVLYFFIDDTDLWELFRDCRKLNLVIGQDVGLLSHNDHIIKEIIAGGIATISTNFNEMAIKAADYVKHGILIHEIIPADFIQRNSL